MKDIEIVIAASAETAEPDEWEAMLLMLCKELVRRELADEPSWGLGGQWSYMTRFSNDTFILSPFCWCERDDCPYCAGCECPDEAFWYSIDGKPCTWKTSSQFFKDNTPDINTTPFAEWSRIAREVNSRRASGQHEHLKCDYCKGTKWAEYGQVKDWGVPLFWHKPSGVRITWHKWAGRDTRVYLPDGCTITPADVLSDCLESLEAQPCQSAEVS